MKKISDFKSFFNANYSFVEGIVSSKISSFDDADDVIQNVFIHIWKHYRAVSDANYISIIRKTCNQEIANYYRKKVLDHQSLDTLYDIDYPTEESDDIQSVLSKIQTLMNKLPYRRRTIFWQSRVENKSYKEISLEHGMSVSAVENQIRKALDFLREQISK